MQVAWRQLIPAASMSPELPCSGTACEIDDMVATQARDVYECLVGDGAEAA